MPYVADLGQWRYDSSAYATQALLDGAFANGSYGLSLKGGAATISVNLAGDLYPEHAADRCQRRHMVGGASWSWIRRRR